MKLNLKVPLIFGLVLIISLLGFQYFNENLQKISAQNENGAKLLLSPPVGSFLVGSTFDVSIIVDTKEYSVNTVGVNLKFPADKLQIVTPSSGKSFISMWLEPPVYSNIDGNISFVGGTPEGIKTSSGIVSIVTFRVIKQGEAILRILPSSRVLAHDGKGSNILSDVIGAIYTLKTRPPEGPIVFSKTHIDETNWYNNNPIISWEKETNVTDFSFTLNNYPQTVPDNISNSQKTTKAYENLSNGLWYFHIKARSEGVWGAPSHFLIRIDTNPPASFKPKVEFLTAAIIDRAFVSFFTTDALSGLDHYEVAVIDKAEPPLDSPIFIEAESPYQLPRFISGNLRIVVRAVDNAGNIKEEPVDADFPTSSITTIISIFLGALVLVSIYLAKRFLSKKLIIAFLKKIIEKIKHTRA